MISTRPTAVSLPNAVRYIVFVFAWWQLSWYNLHLGIDGTDRPLESARFHDLTNGFLSTFSFSLEILQRSTSVNGDPANGRELFAGTCSACHGTDGKKINFHDADDPEYIGTVAAGNPWEFFHKASFGQPAAPMPMGQAMGWTLEEIADIIAYAQTLPVE